MSTEHGLKLLESIKRKYLEYRAMNKDFMFIEDKQCILHIRRSTKVTLLVIKATASKFVRKITGNSYALCIIHLI